MKPIRDLVLFSPGPIGITHDELCGVREAVTHAVIAEPVTIPRIADCVNGCAGIEDPQEYRQKVDRLARMARSVLLGADHSLMDQTEEQQPYAEITRDAIEALRAALAALGEGE